MLFPVYWMVNASLQPGGGGALDRDLVPAPPDFTGYATAISEQGAHLLTSLIIALGSVVFSPDHRDAGRVRPGAVQDPRHQPGAVRDPDQPDDPGHRGRQRAVQRLQRPRPAQQLRRPDPGRLQRRHPVRDPDHAGLHDDDPEADHRGGPVDGAGHFRAFFSIVVPISRNAIITAALFTFLFTWSDFLFALTLTTGENVRPVTLGIYQYIGSHVQDWSAVMATAVLASLPALVLLVVAQKYIAAGATGGAVK